MTAIIVPPLEGPTGRLSFFSAPFATCCDPGAALGCRTFSRSVSAVADIPAASGGIRRSRLDSPKIKFPNSNPAPQTPNLDPYPVTAAAALWVGANQPIRFTGPRDGTATTAAT